MMGLKPSQLRQDFHHFGGFGQPGHPYDSRILIEELKRIYGVDKYVNLLLAGATSLASFFCENEAFPQLNINVCGIMTLDRGGEPDEFYGFKVMKPADLKDFMRSTHIDIGVICCEDAEAAFKVFTDHGIKGVWNPTCHHLRPREGCIIYNENLAAGLLTLIYNLHHS